MFRFQSQTLKMILPGFPWGGSYSRPNICHVNLRGLARGWYPVSSLHTSFNLSKINFRFSLMVDLHWCNFTGGTSQNIFLQPKQKYHLQLDLSADPRIYMSVSCVNFHDALHTTWVFKIISRSITISFARKSPEFLPGYYFQHVGPPIKELVTGFSHTTSVWILFTFKNW